MNTRKFPRTLDEAFPHGVDYGCALERPINAWERVADVLFAIVVGTCLALALVSWWAA